MATLGEMARLIRSKNAGPFELTFDIMFDDRARFEHVRDSGVLSAALIARLFHIPESKARFFVVPEALAFKASIPRPYSQGDLLDADNHGGQQYAPLVDIEIP
jgi:Domain of unknown function (DUF4387)